MAFVRMKAVQKERAVRSCIEFDCASHYDHFGNFCPKIDFYTLTLASTIFL